MRLCRGFPLVVAGLILAGCTTVVPPPSGPSSAVDQITASYQSPSDAPRILEAIDGQLASHEQGLSGLSTPDLSTYSNLLLAAGRLADAEKSLVVLDQRRPGDRVVLLSLALLAGARGDAATQEVRISAMEKAFPGDPDAGSLRARVFLARGDQAGARAAWLSVLEKREDAPALSALAQLALTAKKPQDALLLADRAVKAAPSDDQAWALSARILTALGRYQAAHQDLDDALALAPDDPWHHLERGRLAWHHLYDPELAQTDLELTTLKAPGVFLGWSELAEVYEDRLKPRLAYDAWLKALSLRPDYRPAYPSTTMLAFRFKDFAKAASFANQAAKDYPAEYAFVFVEALSLQALGRTQAALNVLEKARPRFVRGSSVDQMFRFLLTPGSDYYLNTALSGEKQEAIRVRLRFYQGCYYALMKSPASAKAVFEEAGASTLSNIPEIAASRDWLDHGL